MAALLADCYGPEFTSHTGEDFAAMSMLVTPVAVGLAIVTAALRRRSRAGL